MPILLRASWSSYAKNWADIFKALPTYILPLDTDSVLKELGGREWYTDLVERYTAVFWAMNRLKSVPNQNYALLIFLSELFSWCQLRFSLKISSKNHWKFNQAKIMEITKTLFWLWTNFRYVFFCCAHERNFRAATLMHKSILKISPPPPL